MSKDTCYYKEINISHHHGSLEAYVVDTHMDNLENWMKEKGYGEASLKVICQSYRVCILRSIHVDEGYRRQGIGTYLLESCIDKADLYGASAIILEADTGERNEFHLVDWYADYDFNIIEKDRENYPLMVKLL